MDLGGLPWLLIFGLVGWVGLARGWTWAVVLAVFCMGVGAADTSAGSAIYDGITGFITALWGAIVGAVNSVA